MVNLKICLITPLFEPWLVGGAENYVIQLAYELVKHHKVVVVTTVGPQVRKPNDSQIIKTIEFSPKNIESLYKILTERSIRQSKKALWHLLDIWNLTTYKSLKKILKEEKPEIVHTNGIKGLSASTFSAIASLKIKHVHTLHDYELISRWAALFRNHKPISNFNFFDSIYIKYMKRISSKVDVVISPSNFVMNFHTKLGFFKNSKKYVIPNGINVETKLNAKESLNSEFLFIGHITENKGPQVLVNAFKKLKNSEAKLHIIGKGPYLEFIKKISKDDQRIFCHGFVEKEKLEEIFDRCSYVTVPSIWYENHPLVLNEVMARGLPVIASKIGGIPEIVKDGYNGFLFEPGDSSSLGDIIGKAIQDKKLFKKLSKNALTTAKTLSFSKHLSSLRKIYENEV